MEKLFGTDGIRGLANTYPMTADMAVKIGRSAALFFMDERKSPKVVVGKDTRMSGDMLESAIAAGICSAGMDAGLTGVLPTPAIAYITSSIGAVAGIVISASHNPFYDNGIKIFNQKGTKLADQDEAAIEASILKENSPIPPQQQTPGTGRIRLLADAEPLYLEFLKRSVPGRNPFKGLKVVLDCSNGATYRIAPKLFQDLGADVIPLFIEPNGKNINANCGSENPATLCKTVVDTRAQIGLAFDGDGDRLIAVDEAGRIVRGDQILAICAKAMKQAGSLRNNVIVTTVMSNIGLGIALKEMGIEHIKTDVGDRYVLQSMIAAGAVLGGEDSGHMIFLDQHTTGDGILASVRLIKTILSESKPLSELSKIMAVFPQVLMNVKVRSKPEIDAVPEIADAIKSVETALNGKGRVLIRYSGTQPLCRVMVEGPTLEETNFYCRQLCAVIEKKIGARV